VNPATPPDALLLIASGCPHCPAVLAALGELVKQGAIGRLEVVNLTRHPEVGESMGVRGVPWTRIGPFELEGLRPATELKQWAERAATRTGMTDYFRELLGGGELNKAIALIRRDPDLLGMLPTLLADPKTELPVRVGIVAIFEEFEGHARLADLVDELGAITRNKEPHLRADAAHLLSLTNNRKAVPWLEALRNDASEQVRDVAIEALEKLVPAGD
jgi:thiol-disulfide isomerase/thioredoxin